MERYIDANAYIKYCDDNWIPLNVDAVNAQPRADVVKVVRCKDCEFRKPTKLHPNEWFCPRRTMVMHEKDLDGYCDEGKRKETKDEGDR